MRERARARTSSSELASEKQRPEDLRVSKRHVQATNTGRTVRSDDRRTQVGFNTSHHRGIAVWHVGSTRQGRGNLSHVGRQRGGVVATTMQAVTLDVLWIRVARRPTVNLGSN